MKKKIKYLLAALTFCAVGFTGYTSYEKMTMTEVESVLLANVEALTYVLEEAGITCSYGDCGDCFSWSPNCYIDWLVDPCEWEGQPIYYCPC